MGSPDAQHGRQLDGMGSGLSSTSKVVILGTPRCSPRRDVDVEFTFVQVGIRDGALDTAGNCGNMSSIVGPAAWDMGLVPFSSSSSAVELGQEGRTWATVRVLNTNTNKLMLSTFRVEGSPLMYHPYGDYEMDGVPGKQSEITMSFLDPGGAKTGKALPTGNPVDQLTLPDGSTVAASLVDVGNPGVFVAASSLGLDAALTPQVIEANPALKTLLEQIRRAGASKMGLDPTTQSVPKIVLLLPPTAKRSPQTDIQCLALSMGQAHKAVPLTLALCLGAASQMPGTVASDLMGGKAKDVVRIGHPSGTVDVGTTVKGGRLRLRGC
ncbi:3-methylitaconate isomerase [Cladobotryum mycophilum]|uniref:3-methylitaconate isomerase n=1 Tax=Cladobotryum mycophilum TaxID=491253 RepID=A0ABR0SAC8_9HYPO